MSVPTRYPSGISTNTSIQTLGNFGMPDPTKWIVRFDDFLTYRAEDWVIQTVGAGAQEIVSGSGGLLLLMNTAAADDLNYLQASSPAFVPSRGKKLFFKARFGIDDMSNAGIVFGLQVVGPPPVTATSGVYFQSLGRTTKMDFVVMRDAAEPAQTLIDVTGLVSDTFMTVGFEYDGAEIVRCYINDKLAGSITLLEGALPSTPLATSFGVKNETATSRVMALDYVFVAQERDISTVPNDGTPSILLARAKHPPAGAKKMAVEEEKTTPAVSADASGRAGANRPAPGRR